MPGGPAGPGPAREGASIREPTPAGAPTSRSGPGERPSPARLAGILSFERSGPEPLYYKLARSVEEAVAAGALPWGSRLLPEPAVAAELHLSVGTVRNAWRYLERRGLISRRQKRGTVVRAQGDDGTTVPTGRA